MSTTATPVAAPTYPEPAELRAAASQFYDALVLAETAVYKIIDRVEAAAREHEGDEYASDVTFDYLGRYTAFVQALRHDLGEVARKVERAEALIEAVALDAEFEGPDAR